jgi:hypothetical protein
MANEKTGAEILGVGVKAAGEYLIPGGSNLIKGDLATGVTYAALGFLAKAAFGIPGLVVVSLNSLTKSVTGKNAMEYLGVWEGRSCERNEHHHPAERRPAAE